MFRFSKFQKGVKFFKIKLSFINLIDQAFGFGINYKMWFAIFFFIAIIIPYPIKSNALIASQIGSELNNSDFVSVECQGKGFIDTDFRRSFWRILIVNVP